MQVKGTQTSGGGGSGSAVKSSTPKSSGPSRHSGSSRRSTKPDPETTTSQSTTTASGTSQSSGGGQAQSTTNQAQEEQQSSYWTPIVPTDYFVWAASQSEAKMPTERSTGYLYGKPLGYFATPEESKLGQAVYRVNNEGSAYGKIIDYLGSGHTNLADTQAALATAREWASKDSPVVSRDDRATDYGDWYKLAKYLEQTQMGVDHIAAKNEYEAQIEDLDKAIETASKTMQSTSDALSMGFDEGGENSTSFSDAKKARADAVAQRKALAAELEALGDFTTPEIEEVKARLAGNPYEIYSFKEKTPEEIAKLSPQQQEEYWADQRAYTDNDVAYVLNKRDEDIARVEEFNAKWGQDASGYKYGSVAGNIIGGAIGRIAEGLTNDVSTGLKAIDAGKGYDALYGGRGYATTYMTNPEAAEYLPERAAEGDYYRAVEIGRASCRERV